MHAARSGTRAAPTPAPPRTAMAWAATSRAARRSRPRAAGEAGSGAARGLPLALLELQGVELVDIDGGAAAEHRDDDRQPDRRLGGCRGDDEEHGGVPGEE